MNINKQIELNRASSINNFKRIFEILEDKAWNIAIGSTKKERTGDYAEFERLNDILLEEIIRINNDFYDLEQAMDAMPKDIRDEMWKKWCEIAAEREAIDEDEEEDMED